MKWLFRHARSIFIMLFVLNLLHLFYYVSMLPAQVAIHFNKVGIPDGFVSHKTFINLVIFFLFFLFLIFLFSAWVLKHVGSEIISLKNKNFWLAEKKRPVTLFILQALVYHIANCTYLFFLLIQHFLIQSNLTQPPHYSAPTLWIFFIYIILVVFIVFYTLSLFRRTGNFEKVQKMNDILS